VNGVTLEYEIRGQGEPILFISAVVADGFLPLQVRPVLADRYQLIRYHKRGLAGSTHDAGMVSMQQHAADAAALLEHLGIAHAQIAGHSAGGDVALQLALDRPDLVGSLILLEPTMLDVPSAQSFLQRATPAIAAYSAGNREQAMAIFLSAVSGLDWDSCRRAIDERVPGGTTQAIADADTFFNSELPSLQAWSLDRTRASRIAQPALIVVGSRTEPMFVEAAERLVEWLPRTQLRPIERAGHLLHMQEPDAVATAIAEFCASVLQGSSPKTSEATP
jgi:pimeloyl-ACP methyl ester carboxylesterase